MSRPGFVRLNLPYFMSHDAVEFVLKAVEMVTEHGWKLLPQVQKKRGIVITVLICLSFHFFVAVCHLLTSEWKTNATLSDTLGSKS